MVDLSALLSCVHDAYREASGTLTNEALYSIVAEKAGIPTEALTVKEEIGKAKARHCIIKRKIRWYQQTLKMMGLVERVDGERGVWRIAQPTKKGLHEAPAGVHLLAFSTALGIGIWADSRSLFSRGIGEPIHLVMTSPPYPLRCPRDYGNKATTEWIDWFTKVIEPLVDQLASGGSLVINISNDIFEPGAPSRSLYVEEMALAMRDRLGLFLMDRIPWINNSKPPSPTKWACRERVQMCAGWEPIYWFTNDPHKVRSNNNRVLLPHTEEHLKFLEQGNRRVASYGDGAYRLRGEKSYANITQGKIPKNVIVNGHRCADTLALRRKADELGLPSHPAVYPTSIPDQLIRFLTGPGDLVVDPLGGWFKTALAAERNERRWIICDRVLEYVRVGLESFRASPGFWCDPVLCR